MFGGLGIWELLVIFLIILLFFGARRLPEIGASLGKGIREFRGSLKEVGEETRRELSRGGEESAGGGEGEDGSPGGSGSGGQP
ncbi:MAG: twin-arginine translocase TatA/TatE family subunit [Gemmatimonadota bacterium]